MDPRSRPARGSDGGPRGGGSAGVISGQGVSGWSAGVRSRISAALGRGWFPSDRVSTHLEFQNSILFPDLGLLPFTPKGHLATPCVQMDARSCRVTLWCDD